MSFISVRATKLEYPGKLVKSIAIQSTFSYFGLVNDYIAKLEPSAKPYPFQCNFYFTLY